MINVFFGMNWEAIRDPDVYFASTWKEEWFDDDIVKRLVKDIDNTDVVSRHCMMSPVLGQIPPIYLSGGVKTLILLLKDDEFVPDLIVLGDNCSRWLAKIGEIKDITVSMSGYELFLDEDFPLNAKCLNDGSIIKDTWEWYYKSNEFVEVAECGVREVLD